MQVWAVAQLPTSKDKFNVLDINSKGAEALKGPAMSKEKIRKHCGFPKLHFFSPLYKELSIRFCDVSVMVT